LKHAADELQEDKAFVLSSIFNSRHAEGDAFEHASNDLQDDEEFVVAVNALKLAVNTLKVGEFV
jgi:hypothetical protein